VKAKLGLLGATALLAVACGGGAKSPHGDGPDYGALYTAALREESTGSAAKARAQYEDLVLAAVDVPTDARALPALVASLDALVERTVEPLRGPAPDSALWYRSAPDPDVEKKLSAAMAKADDPFSRGVIARSLEELALRRGDAKAAAEYRAARGCASEATVTGPLDWALITGVGDKDALSAADAPIAASYRTPGAFGVPVAPAIVDGRGCELPLGAASPLLGVRDVIVDAEIADEQDIGVALETSATAVLRVGGKDAIVRPFSIGGLTTWRFATVHVTKGTVRLVARVGSNAGGSVEIDAWDAHGKPLKLKPAAVGSKANVTAGDVKRAGLLVPKTDPERTLAAAALLATGESRPAEHVLADTAKKDDAAPELLLVALRALLTASDLPGVQRAERARALTDRLLEKWPASWEAILVHAELAGDRKGAAEAAIEALKDLDAHRGKVAADGAPILDAFEAEIAGSEDLHDRARTAFARAKGPLAGSQLLDDVERAAFGRTDADEVTFECGTRPGHRRDDLRCYSALVAIGKRADGNAELARVRALYGQPKAFLATTLKDALATNDVAAAKAAYEQMLPGERGLANLLAVRGFGTPAWNDATAKDQLKELLALAATSPDAPGSLPTLLRVLGDDPAAEFEGVAAKLAATDRAKPKDDKAATLLLSHVERYRVLDGGLLRWVMFDVRRVTGTTDIEENAAASPPDIAGRQVLRILRRRIHKKDGRVLEPDRNPNAAQSHADLAQLEQGDVIEALYEGIALPSETGDLVIDTPDLLPERVSVASATLELRVPAAVKNDLWMHPMLGKPAEKTEGGDRILTWTVKDQGNRHLEDGVPKMDQSVGFTYGTAEWSTVARSLHETLAGLADDDPEVVAWAQAAGAGKAAGSRELVEAVVQKAGEAVREANANDLSDIAIGSADGSTARTILATHEGSRTWLIARALKQLGVAVDVVIAENVPYSADPKFPVRFGRFAHPLAVAHVTTNGKPEDVWIDADVSGPPLPAGRISPELRGRSMIGESGAIAELPKTSNAEERDEVDLRLVVDDAGDAKGSLTVLLRGRAAQEIAEALYRIVGVEREKALRGIALGWLPFANVEQVALSSTEGSWQVAVRADVTVPAYAQPEGQKTRTWILPGIEPIHYVYPRSQVATLGATYASEGSRENALAINRAVQYHVHRRVELPKGAQVLRLPGPVDVKDANLEAQRKIAVDGNAIDEEFNLAVTTGTIPTARYAAFVQSAHKADDGFLASAKVKPAK
jgi:hypothetical protein